MWVAPLEEWVSAQAGTEGRESERPWQNKMRIYKLGAEGSRKWFKCLHFISKEQLSSMEILTLHHVGLQTNAGTTPEFSKTSTSGSSSSLCLVIYAYQKKKKISTPDLWELFSIFALLPELLWLIFRPVTRDLPRIGTATGVSRVQCAHYCI
jgi:hypothetical protein